MKTSGPYRAPDEAAGGGAPRRGSVQLRQGGNAATDAQAMLDPANQSLADALRMLLVLVKLALVALAALYVLSGLGRVNEGQRGIRLLFGRVDAANLDPGFQYSLPYPIGELVRVDQGYSDVTLDKEFWVYVQPGTVDPSPDKLSPTPSIKPDQGGSGSVLTSDGSIAHTKWKVSYNHENVANFSQNVLPDHEEALVRFAARRGIVHACAGVDISALLTQSAEASVVVQKARDVAQATLDGLNSGCRINTFSLEGQIPPLAVRGDFARVQSAAANAAKGIDAARAEARNKMLETAGEAADYLILYLDRYEKAVAVKDTAAMTSILTVIDSLLEGREVEVEGGEADVGGQTVTLRSGKVKGIAGGIVAQRLAESQTYRTTIVSRAKSDLRRFEAKLEQFKANPQVMVRREWNDAVGTFMGRDSVQTMFLPLGMQSVNLAFNLDPDIERERDRAYKARLRMETEAGRAEILRGEQFKTGTTQNTFNAN